MLSSRSWMGPGRGMQVRVAIDDSGRMQNGWLDAAGLQGCLRHSSSIDPDVLLGLVIPKSTANLLRHYRK